jgi:putative oxidoreductase
MPQSNPVAMQAQSKIGLAAIYDRFAGFLSKWQSPLLLLIRIYIGYQCAISGFAHLHNFEGTVKQFQEWKIPHPHEAVAISATTELLGGILLLIGLAARLVSIPLLINFLVAMIQTDLAYEKTTEQLKHLWDNQDIILKDTAFPFFAAAVIILIFGPGWLSIDGIIKAMRGKK